MSSSTPSGASSETDIGHHDLPLASVDATRCIDDVLIAYIIICCSAVYIFCISCSAVLHLRLNFLFHIFFIFISPINVTVVFSFKFYSTKMAWNTDVNFINKCFIVYTKTSNLCSTMLQTSSLKIWLTDWKQHIRFKNAVNYVKRKTQISKLLGK